MSRSCAARPVRRLALDREGVLGVQDGANTLGKRVNIYIKYVGAWYKPAEEREIATTLVSQSNVDVITQPDGLQLSARRGRRAKDLVRGQGHGRGRLLRLVQHRYGGRLL